jgi:hypothetical protein
MDVEKDEKKKRLSLMGCCLEEGARSIRFYKREETSVNLPVARQASLIVFIA